MFNFFIGFAVCAACFAFGLLSASTVKGWFTTAEAKVVAAVTPTPPTPPAA